MDILNSYKKDVVGSKNIILISILLSFFIRIYLFFYSSQAYILSDNIFFWDVTLSNKYVSFILSTIFSLGIMLYAVYLNSKYSLIREKTTLLHALIILTFSCNPIFIYMNTGYISLFLFLVCVNLLFASYQEVNPARKAYAIGFILAISSLFSTYNIFYLVLFWIGFSMMRSFSLKSFLTSLLGAITIYWLLFCFCFWTGQSSEFTGQFTHLEIKLVYPTLSLNQTIYYCLGLFLLSIVIINNRIESYKDSIRVRLKISFFTTASIFSLLFFIIDSNHTTNFYIFEFSYILLLVHFFALAVSKWQVCLFYMFIVYTIIGSLIF